MMRRLDEYSPQCKFYTGLFSNIAYKRIDQTCQFITHFLNESLRAYRTPDNEVVVAAWFGWHKNILTGFTETDVTPDLIKTEIITAIDSLKTNGDSTDFNILSAYFHGSAVDPAYEKRAAAILGKKADPVQAELNSYLETETNNITNEYCRVRKYLTDSNIFGSVTGLFAGRCGRPMKIKQLKLDTQFLDDSDLSSFNDELASIIAANNALCDAVDAYERAHAAFKEKLDCTLKLTTRVRNARLHNLKHEISDAKRTTNEKTR